MNPVRHDQRGSVLIMAVIAMLILGVLSLSFALLSQVEVAIGVNYKAQAQAESLAEAGLERGRDTVRTAAGEGCGFTKWTDGANSSSYGCGASSFAKLLHNGVALAGGLYSAVIDNDCAPLVPASIQDPSCTTASPARDTNETAVVTAWATALSGQGRARVRGVVGIDNPWKHVCSNSSQDNPPGYCNEPANRNGTPTITPADPNEYPGGPAAYDDLPRPQLGCSQIDPGVHGETTANCSVANYNYPYPTGKRLVITGDRSKANCDDTVNGIQYQGFFDCALSTPCPAAICGSSGPVLTRKGCVKPGDSRASNTNEYVVAPCNTHTGMVFTDSNVDWPETITTGPGSSATNGILVYVLRPRDFTIQSQTLFGTVVVEGNGADNCNSGRDVWHKNGANVTTASNVYGYPLAYLVFDPVEAVADAPEPTANPFNPQETCMDMGSASGTEIHGIVYSGGNVEFNPIVVDGGVVAFQIQTQSSSSIYGYSNTYGNAAPPPGFPVGSGTAVVLVRKSFIVCGDYSADTSGGTPCQ
jgi:Tfp pilus assembly protein PilX